LDFRVFLQVTNQGVKQGFTTLPGIMNKLEEANI